jgi:hypothetical protein
LEVVVFEIDEEALEDLDSFRSMLLTFTITGGQHPIPSTHDLAKKRDEWTDQTMQVDASLFPLAFASPGDAPRDTEDDSKTTSARLSSSSSVGWI